ncbi:MAG: hypothetical protein PVH60_11095 [Anaerolineales bacterium]|jgi:hypothetical protein
MEHAVGPTPQLTLRVSAATLSRVIFPHPDDNTHMLALEHKATIYDADDKPVAFVRAQPFGGAVRIMKPEILRKAITAFQYDSERSRSEADFRIFIQPSRWPRLLEFCKRESQPGGQVALDCDPARELAEEFKDTLGIQITQEDYAVERLGLVIEKDPQPTANLRAPQQPTVRVYWVDEVRIKNPELPRLMLDAAQSSEELGEQAIRNWKEGGRGRANAIVTAPLEIIRAMYLIRSPEEHCEPLEFEGVVFSGNIPAILEDIDTPKFERIEIRN